jgi:(1->4)-alpha-D-glucan 1-alpha-D-glucosylmutase
LSATGDRAEHIVAFMRADEIISVTPRLVLGLRDGWGRTGLRLPAGRWRDELSGKEVAGETEVGDLLGNFPVALLVRGV